MSVTTPTHVTRPSVAIERAWTSTTWADPSAAVSGRSSEYSCHGAPDATVATTGSTSQRPTSAPSGIAPAASAAGW